MTRGMSLAAWEQNGSLRRELALYEKLAEHGVRTEIISWGDRNDFEIAKRFPWLKVRVNKLGLSPERYECLVPLLHAPAFIAADIIKSNQANGADLALRCANIWGKPFIARCGYVWSFFCEQENPALAEQAAAIELQAFTGAQAVVSTTEEACCHIVERYCLPEKKVHCIPNYIPDYFYAEHSSQKESQLPLITQVGRLAPQKNLFSLIEGCAGLPVRLRLVGDGEERDALLEFADKVGVSLDFLGNTSHAQLPGLLAESAVCALVSHFEGHPKSLIEYMACGRPILATDVPGISPLIEHGETGLLCGTDAASIRNGLRQLLDDTELRARLGQNARAFAERYSLENIAAKELDVYASLPKARKISGFLRGSSRIFAGADKAALRRIKNRCRIGQASQQSADGAVGGPSLTDAAFIAKTAADIQAFIAHKTPAEGLKILLGLDEKLYALSGSLSVAYGNGVHTKHRHTRYHDFFVKRLRPGEQVLDIGCGNGFLAYDMAYKGKAVVTGIDISAENIAVASGRFQHPDVAYTVGNALYDLPVGRFETVVLSNVLEHLPERPAFLQGVLRNLRPERLLVRVPLFERDWRVPLKKELGLEWRLDPTHETEYTLDSFEREITEAGLEITYMEIRWSEIWCELKTAHPAP